MKETFTFNLQTSTVFGPYCSAHIQDILETNGWKKAGVIADKSIVGTKPFIDLQKSLADTGVTLHLVEARNTQEPDYDYLDEVRTAFEGVSCDCLIGIGGGSTMDLTKGVGVLLTNPGKAIKYRGFNKVQTPGIPVILVPTTAGTGSEVTPFAVFTDKQAMWKFGINGRHMYARYAVLDPAFTLSCPRSVIVSSGMDALTHTLESFVARASNPISQLFAKKAFTLLFNALPLVVEEPDNIEFRTQMLLGSYYAGISLMNSGAGPAGAMSYPLGVHYKVPHGLAGGVFLSAVVNFNVKQGYQGYATLYDLIEGSDKSLDEEEKSKAFSDSLTAFVKRIEVPCKLTHFGIASGDIPKVTELVMNGLKAALDQNPIPFGPKEVSALLAQLVE